MENHLVILAHRRSGSTFFGQLFHPFYNHEILTSHKNFVCCNYDVMIEDYEKRRKGKNKSVYKIMVEDAMSWAIEHFAWNYPCKKVVLYRRNPMAVFLSFEIFIRNRVGHITDKSQRSDNPITIDISYAENSLIASFRAAKYTKWLGETVKLPTFCYEDGFSLDKVNPIRSSIGLPYLKSMDEIPGLYTRTSDEDYYKSVITNYDEVIDKLAKKYGHPFDDSMCQIWKDNLNTDVKSYLSECGVS